jgi:hypothetical protein
VHDQPICIAELAMTEQFLLQLVDVVKRTSATHCKLTLLVGASGVGKTNVLRQIAFRLEYPVINLNLLLSHRLLGLNARQRTLHVKQIAMELIELKPSTGICLDNTELLFDATLHLDPLRFFQELARNRVVIATWNGTWKPSRLTYAWPGHPDEFDQPAVGFPVVSLTSFDPVIHLTA